MPLHLIATVAGQEQSWPLDQPLMTVGRSSRHTVHLPDPSVSRDHAEIILTDGRPVIRDLGSRNGTRLNGVRVEGEAPLSAGDRLEIGAYLLLVADSPSTQKLRFADATVMGSSLRLRADQILQKRAEKVVQQGGLPIIHWLAEAGQMLVVPKPLRETCDELLGVVERAVPASRYVLLLIDKPDAEPEPIASRHAGASSDRPLALSRTILRHVLESGSAVMTRDPALDPRFQGQHSMVTMGVLAAMAVPLYDNHKILGVLYVDTQDPRKPLDEQQLEVVTLLGNMAAVKITNARLLEAEQERMRIAQELATATRIQRGMLPEHLPEVHGWHFDAFLETCHEVGGDLYDLYRRGDGRLVLLVGDISGKGTGAALLMSSVLSSARVLYETCPNLKDLVAHLDSVVQRAGGGQRFLTAFVGCLDPATGKLDYVNAGHPAPRICRGGKQLDRLEAGGIPLGIIGGYPYEECTAMIGPGELLAVYTDGIPEAQKGDDFYDDHRFDESLLECSKLSDLSDIRRQLIARVDAFLDGAHRSDDLTLVMARREA